MSKLPYVSKDKFEGCIVGLAIGDALGMPCEGYSMDKLNKTFGRITDYLDPPEGQFNHGKLTAGMYTDDTEQAIVLAESLLENGGLNVGHLEKKLLGEYGKNIIEHSELDRWIGKTFKKAVENYISGMPSTKCGVKSKSCGSAMRVAPIGMNPVEWATKVRDLAAKSSKVTHLGKEPTAAAEAVALHVHSALKRDKTFNEMVFVVSGIVGIQSAIMEMRLDKAYKLRDKKPRKVIKIFGDGHLAREVVPTAIYAFHKYPYNFEEAVLTAIEMGGDTDSRAAITGAISGAWLGIKSIPHRWIANLENKDKLLEIGRRFYNSCPI